MLTISWLSQAEAGAPSWPKTLIAPQATSSQVFSLPISPSCNFSYPVQPLRRPAQDHTPERSHSCNVISLLRCVSVLPLLYRSTPSHWSTLLSLVPSLTSYAPAFSLPGLDCMPMCPCAHTDTQHGELRFPAFYRPSSQSESLCTFALRLPWGPCSVNGCDGWV